MGSDGGLRWLLLTLRWLRRAPDWDYLGEGLGPRLWGDYGGIGDYGGQ